MAKVTKAELEVQVNELAQEASALAEEVLNLERDYAEQGAELSKAYSDLQLERERMRPALELAVAVQRAAATPWYQRAFAFSLKRLEQKAEAFLKTLDWDIEEVDCPGCEDCLEDCDFEDCADEGCADIKHREIL